VHTEVITISERVMLVLLEIQIIFYRVFKSTQDESISLSSPSTIKPDLEQVLVKVDDALYGY